MARKLNFRAENPGVSHSCAQARTKCCGAPCPLKRRGPKPTRRITATEPEGSWVPDISGISIHPRGSARQGRLCGSLGSVYPHRKIRSFAL